MKRIIFYFSLSLIIMSTGIFSGCAQIKRLLNIVPEKYTEGINYDRDYPDDDLEVYDNAVVFESDSRFDNIILSCGTADDLDDIIDFYEDFFEDNDIVLKQVQKNKDYYYASGITNEYMFEIEIEEAKGDYIADLFEYVIYISIEEISDEQQKETTSNPQSSASDLINTPDQISTPTPSKETTIISASPQETQNPAISYLPYGTWSAISAFNKNNEEVYLNFTIHINDDNSGTMYYFSFAQDTNWWYDFTYTIINEIITFNLSEGSVFEFTRSFEDGNLRLINKEYFICEYILVNWDETYDISYSKTEFSAYGSFLYYEPETGYMDTISFWPDGTGYYYNWEGDDETTYIKWEYKDGIITLHDEHDREFSYEIIHRGDAFELHQSDGKEFFYHRIHNDFLTSGMFVMEETNEPGLNDFTITFYEDGRANYTQIYAVDNDVVYTSGWYIEPSSGRIHIYMHSDGTRSLLFEYHYDINGLLLVDIDNDNYYKFVQVG